MSGDTQQTSFLEVFAIWLLAATRAIRRFDSQRLKFLATSKTQWFPSFLYSKCTLNMLELGFCAHPSFGPHKTLWLYGISGFWLWTWVWDLRIHMCFGPGWKSKTRIDLKHRDHVAHSQTSKGTEIYDPITPYMTSPLMGPPKWIGSNTAFSFEVLKNISLHPSTRIKYPLDLGF
jgi:hypothetical protein